MRAAHHAAAKKNRYRENSEMLIKKAEEFISKIKIGNSRNTRILAIQNEIQGKMSEYAGFLRDKDEISALRKTVKANLKNFFENIGTVPESKLYMLFKLRDMLITADSVLAAMEKWCADVVYRGGAIAVIGDK